MPLFIARHALSAIQDGRCAERSAKRRAAVRLLLYCDFSAHKRALDPLEGPDSLGRGDRI